MKKQRPKKKDDEINPIWETLLKVIFDVTRLKGDIRNARLDKFLKEAQFDRKQSVCGKYRLCTTEYTGMKHCNNGNFSNR